MYQLGIRDTPYPGPPFMFGGVRGNCLQSVRCSLSVMQADRINAATSAAYLETPLDLDASRWSNTLASDVLHLRGSND